MNEEKTFKSGEVMSMLEQMNDGIKIIGEQYGELNGKIGDIKNEVGSINDRLDGIDGRLDGIDGRFDGIDGRLDGIDGRLDGIDGRLDGIDGRFDGIDGKLEIMQDDITEIKHKLSEKVDREEFNKLENRVIKMEKLLLAKLA